MFLSSLTIHPNSVVAEIVKQDYRTADVFKKYEIEFCCGGKWPLETICMMKGIEMSVLQRDLKIATRNIQLPAFLAFHNWSIDFLTNYIINIHHSYLKTILPDLKKQLEHFVEEHANKYPALHELQTSFSKLNEDIIPHLKEEEELIFPYVRQLAHAYESNDSYAGLLVKTLRKPVKKMADQEQEILETIIFQLRKLTGNYIPPEKACTNHRVIFSKLKELDSDLVQHIHLENDILFPRVLAMEKELLGRSG